MAPSSSGNEQPTAADEVARELMRYAVASRALARPAEAASGLPVQASSAQVGGVVSIAVVAAQEAAAACQEAQRATAIARRGMAAMTAVSLVSIAVAALAVVQYERLAGLMQGVNEATLRLEALQASAIQPAPELQVVRTIQEPLKTDLEKIEAAAPSPVPPARPRESHKVHRRSVAVHPGPRVEAHLPRDPPDQALQRISAPIRPAPPTVNEATVIAPGSG